MRTLLEQFQGFALQPELWESEIFRTRLQFYDGKYVRQFAQRGEYFSIGLDSGRSQWIGRGEGALYLKAKEQSLEGLSKHALDVYEFFKENGASFLSDIREHTSYSLSTINKTLSELFWRGLITNDVVDEVVNIKRYRAVESELPAERIKLINHRLNPLKAVAMKSARQAFKQVPGWNGRWSLVHTKSILGAHVSDEEKIQHQVQQLLLRYGVVAREIAKREENLLPWSMLAMEFQRMEMRGEIRRGYFVEGLSGMQFALPEAVRMLDEIKTSASELNALSVRFTQSKNELPIVLNACDPANPYGVGVDLHSSEPFAQSEGFTAAFPRISRLPGNYIIFSNGTPIVWIENYGLRIFILSKEDTKDVIVQGFQQFINHIRTSYPERNELILEYCNTLRPSESGFAELFRSLGFYRDRVQTMRLDLR